MLRRSLWLVSLLLLFCPSLLAGPVTDVTEENYPRVDSSTSTDPLASLLLCRALDLPGELRRLPWAYGREAVLLTFPVEAPAAQVELFLRLSGRQSHSGTHGAYATLIAGQSDLILAAREPSPDELKEAQARKASLAARPVALDAFVFLVHRDNPVASLTLDQLRAIYSGQTINWQQTGGPELAIRAYTRDRNSGSEELMQKLVMQGRPLLEGGDHILYGMNGPIEAVSRDPAALAYSVFYYEHVMSPHPKNKLLAVNGVAPSPDTIASRRYPLVAPVYVVTRQDLKPDSPAARLRDWLLSAEGQRLVAEAGYVPAQAESKP